MRGKTGLWLSARGLVAATEAKGLAVNRKRVLRVMRERGLLVRSRRLRARRKKEWGRVEAAGPNQIWQSDMTKIWAGPAVGWAYLVSVIDCCTREIVGWNLSHRCRTEDALAAVEQAVLARLPEGSREANCDADHRQRNAVHFVAVSGNARAARHHASAHGLSSPGRQQLHRTVPSQPEGRGSLDGGVSELGRSASVSIARWIEEYNHDRPHRGVENRTPHEAFLAFAAVLNSEALTV